MGSSYCGQKFNGFKVENKSFVKSDISIDHFFYSKGDKKHSRKEKVEKKKIGKKERKKKMIMKKKTLCNIMNFPLENASHLNVFSSRSM